MRLATMALGLWTALAGTAMAETVTVVNESAHSAKVAAPGGRAVRVPAGETAVMRLTVTTPHGVDAKAWWTSDPRQLCIIFVRYGGTVKVSGRETIRCLGH